MRVSQQRAAAGITTHSASAEASSYQRLRWTTRPHLICNSSQPTCRLARQHGLGREANLPSPAESSSCIAVTTQAGHGTVASVPQQRR
jgi:hypothetical protein